MAGLAEQLERYGKKLEDGGHIKEAEKLYLALDKADLAINMYKNFQRYDEVSVETRRPRVRRFSLNAVIFQMMVLVSKYHGDLVGTTHVHLAHECESQGNYRAAESHYVQAGEWKLAVKMYRSLDMWEEAYKVIMNIYVYRNSYTSRVFCKCEHIHTHRLRYYTCATPHAGNFPVDELR